MKPAYRQLLEEEFECRRSRNLSYSLRAFARDLGVPAPKLSQYLNGACGFSGQRAQELGRKLKLGEMELELFVASAEAQHARNGAAKLAARDKVQRLLASHFTALNLEKFALIRDWHHMAILELLQVRACRFDPGWIARELRLPHAVVSEALDRLETLGLIDRGRKTWRVTMGDFATPPDLPSRAIREYHRQVLDLAGKALENIPPAQREYGVLNCNLDQDLVPEMKKLVRKFLHDASSLTKKSRKKDSVYVLSTQFFPLYLENP